MLLIDDRWTGLHGIARFAQQVLTRLDVPHRRLGGPTGPTSPLDVLNPRRLVLPRQDTVYTPGFNAGLTRARQILTVHDLIHLAEPAERSRAKVAYYDRIVRPAIRRAGLVLTVSATSRAELQTWLADDDIDVVDVGNGCADLFFRSVTGDESPTAAGDILYVGNLKPHKNPEVAFGAVARLPGRRLTVVTSDRDGALLLAGRHGIGDRTTILSGIDDDELARLYRSHAALAMPSKVEGFGLPAVEALACGLPVAYWSGCAAVADVVGVDGVPVDDADDFEAWASALEPLLGRPRADRIAPPGWRERYSWDAVAGRVGEAIRSA